MCYVVKQGFPQAFYSGANFVFDDWISRLFSYPIWDHAAAKPNSWASRNALSPSSLPQEAQWWPENCAFNLLILILIILLYLRKKSKLFVRFNAIPIKNKHTHRVFSNGVLDEFRFIYFLIYSFCFFFFSWTKIEFKTFYNWKSVARPCLGKTVVKLMIQ